jgi:hypothetical protein
VSQHELPTLTAAARAGRLKLLWLPLRPSDYSSRELSTFQALVDPQKPLATESGAQGALAVVCNRIVECLNDPEQVRLPKAG